MKKEWQDEFRENYIKSLHEEAWRKLCQAGLITEEFDDVQTMKAQTEKMCMELKEEKQKLAGEIYTEERQQKIKSLNETIRNVEKKLEDLTDACKEAYTVLLGERGEAMRALQIAEYAKRYSYAPPVEAKDAPPVEAYSAELAQSDIKP